MNQVIAFFTHNGVIGVIVAILVIVIIIALVKAALKLATVLIIIGVVLVVFFGFSPNELINKGKAALNGATSIYHKSIEPSLNKEIDQAEFNAKPNGGYTINTPDMHITGQKDGKTVNIEYNGHTYTIDVSQMSDHIQKVIHDYINQQKQDQK